MRVLLLAIALYAASTTTAIGCATSRAAERRPSSPFTTAHARLFDDGVDFVARPEDLEGQWKRDWIRDLKGRVREADAVALVRVVDLVMDVAQNDERLACRLRTAVRRQWLGELPRDLELLSVPNDAGYAALLRRERELAGKTFVLFVKWEERGDLVVPRFHLSPGNRAVGRRALFLVERRLTSEGRPRRAQTVVVHDD